MALVSIYKKENNELLQKIINQGEEVPFGWTTNLDDLDFEKEPSEIELLKEENKLLKEKIEKQEKDIEKQTEDITNTQMALADVFEMLENLV
jgi:flagellar capping protein FliD